MYLPDCMYDYRVGGESMEALTECTECECELYVGGTAYYVDGSYYCEDCMSDIKELEVEEYHIAVGNHCCECGEVISAGDSVYNIDGAYWCEECIEDCKESSLEEY